MNEESPQQEPSMEEILASIRRIISEDGEEGEVAAEGAEAPPSAEAQPETEPEPEDGDDDVLELTNLVPEEAPAPATEPAEEAPPEAAASRSACPETHTARARGSRPFGVRSALRAVARIGAGAG